MLQDPKRYLMMMSGGETTSDVELLFPSPPSLSPYGQKRRDFSLALRISRTSQMECDAPHGGLLAFRATDYVTYNTRPASGHRVRSIDEADETPNINSMRLPA